MESRDALHSSRDIGWVHQVLLDDGEAGDQFRRVWTTLACRCGRRRSSSLVAIVHAFPELVVDVLCPLAEFETGGRDDRGGR